MESNRWAASRLAAHFDVTPAHAMIPSGAESLHGRFLGSETRGITFHAVGLRLTVADFALGENPLKEAITVARNGLRNTRNFGNVYARADDHGGLR
jgi:hypothetical protein